MIVAIHQPHYFPWLGYLEKMAHVDKFIFLDKVQLEKGSYMLRNRIIDSDGNIRYLSISCEYHWHLKQEYREIRAKEFERWTNLQKGRIISAYKRSKHFDEIWEVIFPIFNVKREFLSDITIDSIQILRELFKIDTPVILQSKLQIEKDLKKNDLVLGICKAVGADTYYSGNGARKYMKDELFEKEGVHVKYQQFEHPVYKQIGNHAFVPGLSALDILFNCGVEGAREIFWNSAGE